MFEFIKSLIENKKLEKMNGNKWKVKGKIVYDGGLLEEVYINEDSIGLLFVGEEEFCDGLEFNVDEFVL